MIPCLRKRLKAQLLPLSILLATSKLGSSGQLSVQGGNLPGHLPPRAAGGSDKVRGGCAWVLQHPKCGRNCVLTQPFALSLGIMEGCATSSQATICEP